MMTDQHSLIPTGLQPSKRDQRDPVKDNLESSTSVLNRKLLLEWSFII